MSTPAKRKRDVVNLSKQQPKPPRKRAKVAAPVLNHVHNIRERLGIVTCSDATALKVITQGDYIGVQSSAISLTPSNPLFQTIKQIARCYNKWRPAGPWKFEFERVQSEYGAAGQQGMFIASYNPIPDDGFTCDVTAASELHHTRMMVSDPKHTLVLPKNKLANGSWYSVRDTLANADLSKTDAGFVQLGTYSCATAANNQGGIEVYVTPNIEFSEPVAPLYNDIISNNGLVPRMVDNYFAVVSTASNSNASNAIVNILNGVNGITVVANTNQAGNTAGLSSFSQDVRKFTARSEAPGAVTMFDLLPGVYRAHFDVHTFNNSAALTSDASVLISVDGLSSIVSRHTNGNNTGDNIQHLSGSTIIVIPSGSDPTLTHPVYFRVQQSVTGGATWNIAGLDTATSGTTGPTRFSIQRLC